MESVPKCTLSGVEEGGLRVSQGAEGVSEGFCRPDVIAIESVCDVLPSERGDMGI
jgi:hypothetical protein